MDSHAGTTRGFGRGAVIEQMQKLAAARLLEQNVDTGPSVGNTPTGSGGHARGSGRGQLLELISKDNQSLQVCIQNIRIVKYPNNTKSLQAGPRIKSGRRSRSGQVKKSGSQHVDFVHGRFIK